MKTKGLFPLGGTNHMNLFFFSSSSLYFSWNCSSIHTGWQRQPSKGGRGSGFQRINHSGNVFLACRRVGWWWWGIIVRVFAEVIRHVFFFLPIFHNIFAFF